MLTVNSFLLCCVFLIAGTVIAQDLDPWVYGNLPTKMNSAAISYGLAEGNILSDPSSPIQEFETTTNKIALGYLRTMDIFGKLGRFQVIMPFSFMSGRARVNGKDTAGSRTGFEDLRIRIGLNILGSPPLEPKQFGTYRQEFIFGASMVVTVPVGLYYPERLVNLGTNRWGFKPEIGVSLRVGEFFCELYTGVKLSTANYEFQVNKTLKQFPLYSIQSHVSHTFKKSIRMAISGTYVNGGQTSVNDFKQNNYIRHLRGGVSAGVSLGRSHLIVLQANTTITTNASLDYRSVVLSYSYTWF